MFLDGRVDEGEGLGVTSGEYIPLADKETSWQHDGANARMLGGMQCQ
jgi:hypothetical protein